MKGGNPKGRSPSLFCKVGKLIGKRSNLHLNWNIQKVLYSIAIEVHISIIPQITIYQKKVTDFSLLDFRPSYIIRTRREPSRSLRRLTLVYIVLVLYTNTVPGTVPGIPANFHLRGGEEKEEKEKEKKERKKKEKKEKRRFSQWWTWRINISFFITFWVFCWLDLEFKGCFVFKYFSPRRHYVLNLPNCSISHDFFWGSCTFSFYGSLVVKIFTFLWLQEFWELPKGCHSLIIKFIFPM